MLPLSLHKPLRASQHVHLVPSQNSRQPLTGDQKKRYIDHDWQMTPNYFQVTRIRKVHGDIGHDQQMTPIDFQDSRSKFKVTVT
ncbi:hypothetical protein DPMN_152453 [Dreissena polymorpha]|uniref:Uncharacterized protein n=1 Tax=Dreissena polymorpha TaxID=45954 RepID=A0A9D4FHH2_DREPO|nr:hypothetical protein DPMN_152453 [Dreissena polymorpha]